MSTRYVGRLGEVQKLFQKHKPTCPECETHQIQVIEYLQQKPALWKCRHCKHKFYWEGEYHADAES